MRRINSPIPLATVSTKMNQNARYVWSNILCRGLQLRPVTNRTKQWKCHLNLLYSLITGDLLHTVFDYLDAKRPHCLVPNTFKTASNVGW